VKPHSRASGQVIRRAKPSGEGADRLARLKAAIQTGEYETPEKLDKALHNLLRDLRTLPPLGVSRADETGGERP
jgi:hypothetical protein